MKPWQLGLSSRSQSLLIPGKNRRHQVWWWDCRYVFSNGNKLQKRKNLHSVIHANIIFTIRREKKLAALSRDVCYRATAAREALSQKIPDGSADSEGVAFGRWAYFEARNAAVTDRRSEHVGHCSRWLPHFQITGTSHRWLSGFSA